MPYFDSHKLLDTIAKLELISDEKLKQLATASKDQKKPLTETLLEHNVLSENSLGQIMADITGIQYVRLSEKTIDPTLLHSIPEVVALSKQVVVFNKDKHGLHLAMVNPGDIQTKEFIQKKTGLPVVPYITFFRSFQDAIGLYQQDITEKFTEILERNVKAATTREKAEPAIIEIVNTIIEYAYRNKASDIHIEPLDKDTVVRFRIDGVLHDVVTLPKQLHNRVVTRLKVMSGLRIDEHLAAQDGKIQHEVAGEMLDLRLSIVPITEAEKIVLRLLSERTRQHSFADLGLRGEAEKKVTAAYNNPYGMILSTGPTGSGKTTTLYAVLKLLNTHKVNIMTIEDPVEYDIERVNQIQVNEETELTFAKGLRSIVRQDPDIILVGEIRDPETAGIATNSAMTGHLVLSTLHTNDAATTIPRMIDLGIEPYLIASTIHVIIAQRLVRKICSSCRVSYSLSQEKAAADSEALQENHPEESARLVKTLSADLQKKYFSRKSTQLYFGKGCSVCHGSGYTGRIGVFEVLEMSEHVRDAVLTESQASKIRDAAISEGMKTMIEDGIEKVLEGVTTLTEVLRVSKE